MDNANMTRERSMHRAKLLDRQPLPVRSDVFIHNLDSYTLEALRRAMEQGLKPSGLDFTGDDDSIVILRLTRTRAAGEARSL